MSRRHSILAGMAITAAAMGVQPAAAAEFVIGSIMDITGTNAAIGSRIAKGIELAVENMNQKKYLGDNTMSTTILDRLMHRSALLEFEGKSYRMKEAAARITLAA